MKRGGGASPFFVSLKNKIQKKQILNKMQLFNTTLEAPNAQIMQLEQKVSVIVFTGAIGANNKIEITRTSKKGTETIIPEMSLNNAVRLGVLAGMPVTENSLGKKFYFIPVAGELGKSYDAGKDGYLTIKVENNAIATFMALETLARTTRSIKVDQVYFNAGAQKEINVAKYTGCIFPSTPTNLELTALSGEHAKYGSSNEIIGQQSILGQVENRGAAIVNTGAMVLPLSGILSARVTAAASETAYFVSII